MLAVLTRYLLSQVAKEELEAKEEELRVLNEQLKSEREMSQEERERLLAEIEKRELQVAEMREQVVSLYKRMYPLHYIHVDFLNLYWSVIIILLEKYSFVAFSPCGHTVFCCNFSCHMISLKLQVLPNF